MLSYTDPTPSTSTTLYRIRAVGVGATPVKSPYSNVASPSGVLTTAPPTAPVLTASPGPGYVVNLTWTPSQASGGVTGYFVERCAGEGCTAFLVVTTTSTLNYRDAGFSPLATLRYQVRARSTAGMLGPYSVPVTVTTVPDTTPSSTPRVTAVPVLDSEMSLAFSATDDVGMAGYMLSRCQGATCSNFNPVTPLIQASTYLDTGLLANTAYRYQIIAIDTSGNSSATTIVAATSPDLYPPSPVTITSLTPVNSTRIDVTWSVAQDGTGVSDYFVMRGSMLVGHTTSTSFSDTSVLPGTQYGYSIISRDTLGHVSPLPQTVATVTTPGMMDTTPPSAPTVSGSPGSETVINLTWNSSTDLGGTGVAYYSINTCKGSGCTPLDGIWILGLTSTSPSFIHRGLVPGTTYGYMVKAFDQAGNESAWSAVTYVTTLADPIRPSIPVPTATALAGSTILVTWSPATDNAAVKGYWIWRCSTATCSDLDPEYVPDFTKATSFLESSFPGIYPPPPLPPNTSRWYYVAAEDTAGNRSYSTIVGATTFSASNDTTPPSPPSSLTGTVVGTSRIDLAWSGASDDTGIAYYIVEGCPNIFSCAPLGQKAKIQATAYSDTAPLLGVNLTYQVRAVDAAGNISAPSPQFQASPLIPPGMSVPRPPADIVAYPDTPGSLIVSWMPSPDDHTDLFYLMEMCQGAGCLINIGGAAQNVIGFRQTGVTAGTIYRFKVQAENYALVGEYSPTITVLASP